MEKQKYIFEIHGHRRKNTRSLVFTFAISEDINSAYAFAKTKRGDFVLDGYIKTPI